MNCIKNERIKNEIIKNERIKNERIKNELIKKELIHNSESKSELMHVLVLPWITSRSENSVFISLIIIYGNLNDIFRTIFSLQFLNFSTENQFSSTFMVQHTLEKAPSY